MTYMLQDKHWEKDYNSSKRLKTINTLFQQAYIGLDVRLITRSDYIHVIKSGTKTISVFILQGQWQNCDMFNKSL